MISTQSRRVEEGISIVKKSEPKGTTCFSKKYLLFFSLCLCVSALNLSCASKATDPRSVIPADALVYLETNDLGRMLSAITDNPKFQELAKNKPDLSALKGMRLAVAVTGFETSEQQVTEENSVLNFQPHFVAVAETNAWGWQTSSFTENQLGEFINEVYGGEVELEVTPKNDGKYYIWKAQDGRKAYALVEGSVIYFGNDESSIEKCLAVKRGEADSIAKNSKISSAGDNLAFGYISPDGIAQLSNLTGVSMAMKAGEAGEVKSFIARVLPEVLRNSVKELTWTANKTEDSRIEDKYSVALDPDTVRVFSETFVPSGSTDQDLSRFVPAEFVSTTRYSFKDPQIAWRSVVLTAQHQTDKISGKLLTEFSSSLFEPYAVEDAESFLSAAGNTLQTATFDAEGDDVAVITRMKDVDKIKKSVTKDISLSKPPEKLEGADLWRSDDGELAAAISDNYIVLGDAASVVKCLQARSSGNGLAAAANYARLAGSNAVIATIGNESDPAAKLIDVLADRKNENTPLTQNYLTETRFNQYGIDRTTVSDFGLIGAIIEKFGKD